MPTDTATPDVPFVTTRTFAAPLRVVWEAWTQAEHLQKWFGPKGYLMPSCSMDLRPGGTFHYCMGAPNGGPDMWGMWIFREVAPPERLVFVSSFSDPDRGKTRHPFATEWPLETLSTITFAEDAGRTTVRVSATPINATDAERKAFAAAFAGMTKGWAGALDQLEAYLATV